MYANEAPGLGIDIDEKLAAKYPFPDDPHLRLPLGHDPPAGRHGDPALKLIVHLELVASMTWSQNYDPLHAWPLSTLVSALPVVTLFFALVVLKTRVWVAALAGLLMAVVLALAVFGMPATLVAAAGGLGVIFGLLRIAWIIVASIFLYHIAVETGQFQVMKESIAALSTDKRLQLILIAFCFGAFLEGTGGGGAPVAIAGSFLIGLGFEPFQAATLCLLANTAPVAWGAVGNPIRSAGDRDRASRAWP